MPIRTYALLFIALIVSETAALGFSNADSFFVAKTDSKEIDRLFKEVGILSPSNKTPPVEFVLPDPKGRITSISEFRGKIVFLNFWTTWCYACRIEMPAMEKLHKVFRDRDFVMVAINLQEPAERVKQFLKDYKLTFTTLLDTKGLVGAEFGIRSIPTTFILDKEGRIIGKALGPREWGGDQAMALFDYLVEKTSAEISRSIH
jgi:thiol-disulfide isomerase/thioredoxin